MIVPCHFFVSCKNQTPMNKLLLRTITGIILVWIIVEGTLWTEWSFYALWALIGILTLREYYSLVNQAKVFKNKTLPYILGSIYIIAPIWLTTTLDPRMVVTILTIVWANDTGAYIVGSTIGKHKMSPRISPKKSWEGFFGGLLFAMGVSLVWYSLLWSDPQSSIAPLFQDAASQKILWAAFGIVVATAAVVGDLIESKFKRTIGVKDSGTIIPGHGGMLDRFDATLLAIPISWLFVKFLFL